MTGILAYPGHNIICTEAVNTFLKEGLLTILTVTRASPAETCP
jgi:hypothetical protein